MIQLDMTRKYLKQLGIKTAFSNKMIADPEDIVDVDWVHCFNFSMPWTKYQIWNAKKLGKKVAVSMNVQHLKLLFQGRINSLKLNYLIDSFFAYSCFFELILLQTMMFASFQISKYFKLL